MVNNERVIGTRCKITSAMLLDLSRGADQAEGEAKEDEADGVSYS
jgi:hypothetical protein